MPGGGNRTVNIEPALAKILDEHLSGRAAGRVFLTKNGTVFSKHSVRRKLVSVLDKLGLKRGDSMHFVTAGCPFFTKTVYLEIW